MIGAGKHVQCERPVGDIDEPLAAAHPPFGNFVPGARHQLGFDDHKVIEVRDLMELVGAGRKCLG